MTVTVTGTVAQADSVIAEPRLVTVTPQGPGRPAPVPFTGSLGTAVRTRDTWLQVFDHYDSADDEIELECQWVTVARPEPPAGLRVRVGRPAAVESELLGATVTASGRRAAACPGRSARPGRRRAGSRLPSRGHESRDGHWRRAP
jgi:hypothetical protein